MKTSHMYSIVESVSVSREPLLPVICRRDENPLHLVYILFTSASAAGEVKTPSKRCTIRSPFRAVHCRENRKKPQSKMSNLFLSRLYCSTFLAPVPRWLCREMSESRQRPVVAPDAVFRRSFQHPGEGGKVIFAVYRRISHAQSRAKIMHKAKLRHALTPFSSRNVSTATIYVGWNQRNG